MFPTAHRRQAPACSPTCWRHSSWPAFAGWRGPGVAASGMNGRSMAPGVLASGSAACRQTRSMVMARLWPSSFDSTAVSPLSCHLPAPRVSSRRRWAVRTAASLRANPAARCAPARRRTRRSLHNRGRPCAGRGVAVRSGGPDAGIRRGAVARRAHPRPAPAGHSARRGAKRRCRRARVVRWSATNPPRWEC